MDNNDERDYSEEEYNRAEMEREAEEERKAHLGILYRTILRNTIDAAMLWERSTQATKEGKDGEAKRHAQHWADVVNQTKKAEQEFRKLADF